ncbi:PepSY domain-containing protein [Emcibacter nanhaiensis]|uniref:PepSY domain-containing protein n=1 Tax=Emcibacter nanhaiensis TaxID=1505037 RepID=A0A501PBA2_9PROT|nr:PepSY domain-containing protein [Emcibacter nanhaiensis]TPD57256.1 PepSY domain-containing protein [Emcibacter nanhaiensis]
MKKINYNFWLRRIHKWLGLIVGIQFLLWTLSGFIMSWFPIGEVRGNHLVSEEPAQTLSPSQDYVSPSVILAHFAGQDVSTLSLLLYRGHPVYQVGVGQDIFLFNALTGLDFRKIDKQDALNIAEERYAGQGKVRAVSWLEEPVGEISGVRLPLWRVDFDDDINSSLYISPDTAKIIRVRSDIWRRHDFFWMLHIMDYEERTDINNLLLVSAASVGLFIVLSGVILIFYAFGKRDFRWLLRGK